MKNVFATGVEARLVLRHEEPDNEASVTIPSHYVIVVAFAGVFEGMLRTWQAAVFTTETADEAIAAEALSVAVRHFPLDGGNLAVTEGTAGSQVVHRVVSRLDTKLERKLDSFGLVRPARDVEIGQQLENHRTVGSGLGFEFKHGKGYIVPYVAVETREERDGHEVVVVVHARLLEPFVECYRAGGSEWGGIKANLDLLVSFKPWGTADIEVMEGGYYQLRGHWGPGLNANVPEVRSRTAMELAFAEAKARTEESERAKRAEVEAEGIRKLGAEPAFVGPTTIDIPKPVEVAVKAAEPEIMPVPEKEEVVEVVEAVEAAPAVSDAAPKEETEDEILARMIAEEEAEMAAKAKALEDEAALAAEAARRKAISDAKRAEKAAAKAAAKARSAQVTAEPAPEAATAEA